jgi:hypothetical protein
MESERDFGGERGRKMGGEVGRGEERGREKK